MELSGCKMGSTEYTSPVVIVEVSMPVDPVVPVLEVVLGVVLDT